MGDILSVSNAQELRKALVDAKGGETIKLASGDYGQLDLKTAATFGVKAIYDNPVTITSADPDDQALFSGIDLRGVKNLTFDNVIFESNYTGSSTWVSPFTVSGTGITFRNSLFEGKLASGTGDETADGFATGKGLLVRGGSSDILVENNQFTTWETAINMGGVKNIQIIGNELHSNRKDVMQFSSVNNILIEDNYMHSTNRSKDSGDHADMIQFFVRGGASENITIRGNTLDIGDGDTTQSIFMRNEAVDQKGAGYEMFYKNLTIEENIILNKHVHGITVGQTDGLVIRNNSVLDAHPANTSHVTTPQINVKSESINVVIEQNVSAGINGYRDQAGWTVLENARLQNKDVNAPGHYEGEFLTSSMGGKASTYIVDPGGTIAQMEAGASRLRLDTSPDSLQAAFDVSNAPDAASSVVFDAGRTYGATGNMTGSDAQFIWNFGDGMGATGQVVRHTYAEAGRYDATLTVVRPDGATATAASEIAIMGTDMLSFDPQTGFFQTQGYGEATEIGDSDRASVVVDDGYGIDLGGKGVATSVGKSHMARFFGAESFDMSMTLRADTLGSTGEVARVHANFDLSVVNRGEVAVRLETDSGVIKLTTTRATVNDGNDHDIRVSLDSEASRLEIYVDGALAAATGAEGAVRADFPRSLQFGHAWGKQNFDGTLTAFELAVGGKDYPDYAGDVAGLPGDAVPVEELPNFPSATVDPAPDAASDGHEAQDGSDPSADVAPPEDHTEAPGDKSHKDPVPLDDSEPQAPTVIMNAEEDRLEVVIDDNATLDLSDPDPVVVSPIGYERGGSISTAWTRHYDSGASDPEDSEMFVDDAPVLTL
jgi:PKD repeat protein